MRTKVPWMTYLQAARFLGMTESSIKNMVRDGILRRRRHGSGGIHASDLVGLVRRVRVTNEDIEALMKENQS